MSREKKPKPLKVKEARALVTELQEVLKAKDLKINELENEFISMTLARDNCSAMHKYVAERLKDKKSDIDELKSQLKIQSKTVEDLKAMRGQDTKLLRLYAAETAGDLMKRSLVKFAHNVHVTFKNLVARLSFRKL